MSKRIFTPEQDKEVVTLYEQGYSTRHIAELYHCEKSAVSGALEREGVARRDNRDLTDGEEAQILKIYQAGYSRRSIAMAYGKSQGFIKSAINRQLDKKERLDDARFNFCEAEEKEIIKVYQFYPIWRIAEAYNCTHKTIRDVLYRHGIPLRVRTKKEKVITRPHRINTFNEQAFDKLDNEAVLYWLGFAYSDGNVSRSSFRFGLAIKDIDHLVKFVEFMNGNFTVRATEKACFVDFNSRFLTNRLEELGIVPRRNHFDKLINLIPIGLEHHFIRGYLDGDGCISSREKVIFLGQEDILLWIKSCLVKYAQTSKVVMPYQRRGIMEIAFGGYGQFRRIIDYIYQDATVYLKRKKEMADKTKRGC